MKSTLKVDRLTKSFIDAAGFTNQLFVDLSFEFSKGNVTSILAPAGSGKSTLLKIIANLETATQGEVQSSGKVLFISEESSVFPWLNVQENISYNLAGVVDDTISETIKLVGLDGYEDHVPHKNSSGFLFRVALASSIVHKPSLILLDEPFDKMKPEVRKKNLVLARKISLQTEIPILLATKNISSAIFLSDRILVMKSSPGEIIADEDITFEESRDALLFEKESFRNYHKKIESIIETQPKLYPYQFSI